MTRRAMILGLLVAAMLGGVTYFNDQVLKGTFLIGNYIPASVFGALMLWVVIANPLLGKIGKKWVWTGKELAVTTAIVLLACCIPGRSLMHIFTNQIMMPHQHARIEPGMTEAVKSLNKRVLADPSENPAALDNFVIGVNADQPLSISTLPWDAWKTTLLFWMPLLITFFVATIGLSLVIHRQWLSHEHLPYPTIQVANAFLPEDGETTPAILRNRTFWIGFGIVLFIHCVNYINCWWPTYTVPIRLGFNFSALSEVFPVLKRYPYLFYPRIYFTALGFAFLVSSQVSFSMGITAYLFFGLASVLGFYGIQIDSRQATSGVGYFLYAGSYLGMFAILVYTGRTYYKSVIQRAFGWQKGDKVETFAIWGARVCIVCSILFAVQLSLVGVDWQLAVAFTVIALAFYVVIGRLVAEGGLFFVQAYLMPGALLWGLLGDTIGPKQLLVMSLVGMIMTYETRELLMPYAVSSFAIADRSKVKLGRLAIWGGVALILTFAIAVPCTLYWQYRRGASLAGDYWTVTARPKMAFQMDAMVRTRLKAQGKLEETEAMSSWQRIINARPKRGAVIAFCIAFGLVILFSFLRFRLKWWPLHPILLLILGSYPGICLGPSFLLGWAIKLAVNRYGGSRTLRKFKPLMIGFIAGEMLAIVLVLVVGGIYYWATGMRPPAMRILPG